MQVEITCKADRFNLSVVGDDFINDCCFGEDFSKWLVAALEAEGVGPDLICMEDFGLWHVALERHRTLRDRLSGRNKTTPADPIVEKVVAVLRTAGFADVEIA